MPEHIPLGGGSILLFPIAGRAPIAPERLQSAVRALCDVPGGHLGSHAVREWVRHYAPSLAPEDRAVLSRHVIECERWAKSLRATLCDEGDPRDYTTATARNRQHNPYEEKLARIFANVGLPLEAEVGVSRDGGSRRGGWYGSYWLDLAHRDASHNLLLDIEMDGRRHRAADRVERDEVRNERLCRRGWYVLRVPSRVLHQPTVASGVAARTVEEMRRHRQVMVMARVGTQALGDAFAFHDAEMGRPARINTSRDAGQHTSVPYPSPHTLAKDEGRAVLPSAPPRTALAPIKPPRRGGIGRAVGYGWAALSMVAGLAGDPAAFWSGVVFLSIMLVATDAWSLRGQLPLVGSSRRAHRVVGYVLLVIVYLIVCGAVPAH